MSRTNGTENHDSLLHGPCKTFVVTVHEDVYDKDVDFEMISSIVDPTWWRAARMLGRAVMRRFCS